MKQIGEGSRHDHGRTMTAEPASIPLVAVLRRARQLVLALMLVIGPFAASTIYGVFTVSYALDLGYSRSQALNTVVMSARVGLAVQPIPSWLSDRVGRRPVVLAGTALLLVMAFPLFTMINTRDAGPLYLGLAIFSLAHGIAYAPLAAWLGELFPTTTRYTGASLGYQLPDGYLLLIDPSGVRKVASGLRFTNEVRIRGGRLYAAETSAGCVARFELGPDGSLGDKWTFGPEPIFEGAKVDGIAFDADGNLWVIEITRNGLHVIRPDGTASTVFEDPDGGTLKLPTSVAFGGPDLRTAYVGSLQMDRIATFRAPVAGAPMYHWAVP